MMYCPSQAAGEGLLHHWVKWACVVECILHLNTSPAPPPPLMSSTAVCAFVCDGASSIGWLCPGCPSVRPQVSNPVVPVSQLSLLGARRAGKGIESCLVYDPLHPLFRQNTVSMIDGVARQELAQHPTGNKVWMFQPECPRNNIFGWRASLCPTAWCTWCFWHKPELDGTAWVSSLITMEM